MDTLFDDLLTSVGYKKTTQTSDTLTGGGDAYSRCIPAKFLFMSLIILGGEPL